MESMGMALQCDPYDTFAAKIDNFEAQSKIATSVISSKSSTRVVGTTVSSVR